MPMYRTEYPNPQFERSKYECLNGTWEFSYGKVHGRENCALDLKIEVSFCPESELSVIHYTDFITDCVYSREIDVKQPDLDGRLVLHFGAVDYKAEVYVNGVKACEHEGGYTAFEADITSFVKIGRNRLTVAVHDDINENVPSGKQSRKRESFGCFYTRVTGIWQTVWLERTPKSYIKQVKFYPNITEGSVAVELITEGKAATEITVYYKGNVAGAAAGNGYYRHVYDIKLAETHLWEIGSGNLYDVKIKFGNDEVKRYFALREVKYEGRKFLLNGKSVFQRLVLDQGYYAKGVYTAPSVNEFRKDITLACGLGFNGVRLHQKVFDQRYLYECDRLGVMVWGEYASWGIRYEDLDSLGAFIAEWTETVEQNFNHPSIITWCPLNETWDSLEDSGKERDIRFVESVYRTTKILDPTRPCIDVSGGYHGKFTDLFDFHCYHSAEEIAGYIQAIEQDGRLVMDTLYGKSAEREGAVWNGHTATHASEYGGVVYAPHAQLTGIQGFVPCIQEQNAWGYSTSVSENEFVERYVETTERFMNCDKICGCCYTQLYDVEQEQNGLFTGGRKPKLSEKAMRQIADCNRAVAAIEKHTVRESDSALHRNDGEKKAEFLRCETTIGKEQGELLWNEPKTSEGR